jgi:hypothetical protein
METPTPGSDEAIERGCTCPVLDNHHGRGFMWRGGLTFWYSADCPIHINDKKEKNDAEMDTVAVSQTESVGSDRSTASAASKDDVAAEAVEDVMRYEVDFRVTGRIAMEVEANSPEEAAGKVREYFTTGDSTVRDVGFSEADGHTWVFSEDGEYLYGEDQIDRSPLEYLYDEDQSDRSPLEYDE